MMVRVRFTKSRSLPLSADQRAPPPTTGNIKCSLEVRLISSARLFFILHHLGRCHLMNNEVTDVCLFSSCVSDNEEGVIHAPRVEPEILPSTIYYVYLQMIYWPRCACCVCARARHSLYFILCEVVSTPCESSAT